MCSSSSSGGSSVTAGNDVGLVTANRGQCIIVGRRVKSLEFALPNRTIVIWASKSEGFRKNQEGWQPY